jgi:uracil-DNA glycosylase
MSKVQRTPRTALRSALATHCDALAACRACGHGGDVLPIVSRAAAPRVMLVGQAPGATEAAGGKPFAGRAGKTLFRWFERTGIDEDTARRHIYIAAVTRCYPGPSPSGRGDRVPSLAEQQACARWLEAELSIIQPELVIPVGRLAIARFLTNRPLDELIGRAHDVEVARRMTLVIPLPHPSGASSWIHQSGHQRLLDGALSLISGELRRLGVVSAGGRSVA